MLGPGIAAVRQSIGPAGLPRRENVIRLIKRYGSRKLYDTEESRYVSLDEIASWVRTGQQIQVVDNQNGDDVTAHTLTQVILENGKRGGSAFSADFLHDLIRRGEQVVSSGVESIQSGVDRLIQASVDRVPPLRALRDETRELRKRLELLESQIAEIETAVESRPPAMSARASAARPGDEGHREPARVSAARVPRRKGA
jgi:polyhydroxyalkanoate synthesis repressor PhaR